VSTAPLAQASALVSVPVEAAPSRSARCEAAWAVLDGVLDPEVPALSVCDLGIVRDVVEHDDGLEIVLTPTYSGCPATEVITQDVLRALERAGQGPARVSLQRAPAWSSDWISEAGRRKLRAYGIAPPAGPSAGSCIAGQVGLGGASQRPLRLVRGAATPAAVVACPRCDSPSTERLSAFGSTACKALYRCLACREPFEYFKPI
jgi:ring-1,2-phenylacetyl-CoA epoxidase subunit PaaD